MGQEGQSLLDLLVSIPALQQPLVSLVLGVLLQCCQQVQTLLLTACLASNVRHESEWGRQTAS